MDGLTLFGFISVAIMVVAYAMEDRSGQWILVFSLACLSSSLYAWLAGIVPFALVELIWSVIAFKRWRDAKE